MDEMKNDSIVFPEWLNEAEREAVDRMVCEVEVALLKNDPSFAAKYNEQIALINSVPALRTLLDENVPVALSQEQAAHLLRIRELESDMHDMTLTSIFVCGRKDAYRFMRSIGMA